MKVRVIGGGPSGMFLAILLRLRGIAEDIVVLEQNPKDATYGFGVGLAESAIDKLTEADPETMTALQDRMHFLNLQVFENCTGEFPIEWAMANGAITRLDILTVLEERCASLEIEVQHDVRINDPQEFNDVDLVVGADGANSIVRSATEAEFGTRRDKRSNYFVWWGCENPTPEMALRFRRFRGSSVMAHYYAYTPEMWTFVGETDEQSWVDLGMDKMSNVDRKALFEEVFEDVLGGRPLVENKSDWFRFEAITNDRWHVGNRVLIGDALFRAHYSIGSGTRLAMEDALGLADALQEHPGDISAALDSFETNGKPRKEKLMHACQASYSWYEQVHTKLDTPILEFIHDFMNRTGRMPYERLQKVAPNFVEAYEARAL